jgi:hypothetical protein
MGQETTPGRRNQEYGFQVDSGEQKKVRGDHEDDQGPDEALDDFHHDSNSKALHKQ